MMSYPWDHVTMADFDKTTKEFVFPDTGLRQRLHSQLVYSKDGKSIVAMNRRVIPSDLKKEAIEYVLNTIDHE